MSDGIAWTLANPVFGPLKSTLTRMTYKEM